MRLLDRRVRGFRLVDLVALGLLTVLILGVYLAKTMAGRERAQIASVERQISAEKARIRLLTAEVSHLEQPSRIERLSTAYLGMAPVPEKREATAETLIDVARNRAGPAPVAAAAAPAAAAPAVNDGPPADEPPAEAPR
jgi:cell division protein FtsL